MSREALVVGINGYTHLPALNAPAGDAEAIAQILEQQGDFRVWRLPFFNDPFEGNAHRVARNQMVSLVQLEDALVQLFKPDSKSVPDTALFFFSGHGLRKQRGIQEGFLASSDSHFEQGFYGLSLQWLRRLLQESPVRQQVVWLDCCHSGELLQFEEADPGDRGKGRDRCFIAASRSHQLAYESSAERHGFLTQALLDGLNPERFPNRGIDNLLLTDYVNQSLRNALQNPVCTNSGEPIRLTYRSTVIPTAPPTVGDGETPCPYKGLAYFDCNDDDPLYFHGRTALVDSLLNQVRQTSFLALVGASGSGKSSLLRAGLLYQLKRGQRLSGSDQWAIHILTPGDRPLQSLALAFLNPELSGIERATQLSQIEALLAQGAEGMRRIVQASPAPRLVLVVDQLEEVFTLCQDPVERQQFFACLLEPLEQLGQGSDSPLLVLLALRADFLGHCMEQAYSGLGDRLRDHLIPVPPMNRDELRQAIVQPAKQVGLDIEPELIAEILVDLAGAPGRLPLLQYTLTELWKQRRNNCLTLHTYTRLGGVLGTLQQRADAVYAGFGEQEQATVRHIFLALTQINEGTEDTRRRVPKLDLVTPQHPKTVVNAVLHQLTAEQLVVTSEWVGKGETGDRVAMVDVAHEALIRHWPLLRTWIEENRDLLRYRQKLELQTEEWRSHQRSPDYLLRGRPLREAQSFQMKQSKTFPLSNEAQAFVQRSLALRSRSHLMRAGLIVGGFLVASPLVLWVANSVFGTWMVQQQSQRMVVSFGFAADPSSLLLMDGRGTVRRWDVDDRKLDTLLAAPKASANWAGFSFSQTQTLQMSQDRETLAYISSEGIRYWRSDHPETLIQPNTPSTIPGSPLSTNAVSSFSLSPDGEQVVFQSPYNGVYLWTRNGSDPDAPGQKTLLEPDTAALFKTFVVPTLRFSPDGQRIGAIVNNALYLWNRDGTPISTPPNAVPTDQRYQTGLEYLRFSADGQRIATSINGTVELWDNSGRRIATLAAVVTDATPLWAIAGLGSLIAFSPDGQRLATFANNTVALWDARNGTLIKTLAENYGEQSTTSPYSAYGASGHPNQLRFSPDGEVLVLGTNEAIALWSYTGDEIAVLPVTPVAPNNTTSGTPNPNPFATSRYNHFDFHPNKAELLTTQVDGTVKLWSFQGEELRTLQAGFYQGNPASVTNSFTFPQGTQAARFSPDGEAIAIINTSTVKLLSPDGEELLEIRANGRPVP